MVAGTLSRLLARRGHRVLALDSDPLPGLALSLGLRVGDDAMLENLAERDPEGRWRIVRNLKPATLVRRAARVGPDGVRFLQFGKVRTKTLAPLASSLQAFWLITQSLEAGPWTIVHDLPAGTRQPFSGWAGGADIFLLVAEPTQKSILAARRLLGVRELAPAADMLLVANKVRAPEDVDVITGLLPGIELGATVPFDPRVVQAERAGAAPIDRAPEAPAVRELAILAEQLESRSRAQGGPR
jgi:CO dehydrogenase maturation factor